MEIFSFVNVISVVNDDTKTRRWPQMHSTQSGRFLQRFNFLTACLQNGPRVSFAGINMQEAEFFSPPSLIFLQFITDSACPLWCIKISGLLSILPQQIAYWMLCYLEPLIISTILIGAKIHSNTVKMQITEKVSTELWFSLILLLILFKFLPNTYKNLIKILPKDFQNICTTWDSW